MADAAAAFSRIDLKTHALLLDVDGTLLDIAPRPDLVVVPPGLIEDLTRLQERAGGAIAFVSGRKIAVLDALFKPLVLPAVGVHGAEMRVGPRSIERRAEPLPVLLRGKLAAGANALGLLSEDKEISVTIHFRQAPEKESEAEALVARACEEFSAELVDIARNKMIVEVIRRGVNKGAGIEALMARPPFAGRMPVFVGDDATDERGFAVMPRFGGMAFSVGRAFPGLAGILPDPAAFRAALHALAQS
jgi:trehalose 6-phosphate phosphatase